jgi:AcrR family transcriptional regulator
MFQTLHLDGESINMDLQNTESGDLSPKNRSFEETKRLIVSSAARVFSRRGYSSGTTKEIAAELQMSQPAVYHYIGSKALLLDEIAVLVASDFQKSLSIALEESANDDVRLRNVVRRFTEALLRNQYECMVFWRERHSFSEDLRNRIAEQEREFMKSVASLVADLQQSNTLTSSVSSEVLAQAIIGMPAWSYQWYRHDRHPDAHKLADVYCDLVGLP